MNEDKQKEYLREYYQQLKRQEDAINNMSAQDFAMARRKFNSTKHTSSTRDGRNPDAKNAQENFRDKRAKDIERSIFESKINKGTDAAQAKADAKKQTKEIMESLAALHEPDMVSGGWDNPTPSRLGDKGVNSAIGGFSKGLNE